jgi:hypothetical protein
LRILHHLSNLTVRRKLKARVTINHSQVFF